MGRAQSHAPFQYSKGAMLDLKQLAADLFGITLTDEQLEQFDTYTRELLEWNEKINLTAIKTPQEVLVRHHLDSLSIVLGAEMRPNTRVIDVGTGAGFPGLALKIAYPFLDVTLLEATGKKVKFLEHVIATLGLSDVRGLHARAEEAGHMPDQRGQYHLVLARAVARLPALCEYMLPLVKVGGRCIAMKGATAFEEVEMSADALRILGGRVDDVIEVKLPTVDEPHWLIVIDKVRETPAPYPRKPGTPTRKPL